MQEALVEAKLSFMERDDYRKMFNALQEGIVVIEDQTTITFMNDLSNKVFSKLANMTNFFKRKSSSGEQMLVDPIDLKLFFLIPDVDTSKKRSKRKNSGNNSQSSEVSKSE